VTKNSAKLDALEKKAALLLTPKVRFFLSDDIKSFLLELAEILEWEKVKELLK
jgi:hypothetical protein